MQATLSSPYKVRQVYNTAFMFFLLAIVWCWPVTYGNYKPIKQSNLLNITGSSALLVNGPSKGSNTANAIPASRSGQSQIFRIDLNIVNDNGSLTLADGIFAEFNDIFSPYVDPYDARKFVNPNENIGFLRYDRTLAIERRPFVSAHDTLYLKLWRTRTRNYQMVFTAENFTNTNFFIKDSYLNTVTPINTAAGPAIFNFSLDGTAASADENRFKILISKYTVLPVTISSVKATVQTQNVLVEWDAENEEGTTKYYVERSADANKFSTVAVVNAVGKNAVHNTYRWTDVAAQEGISFYRITAYNRNGETHSGIIVRAVISKQNIVSMTIFPNPVKGNSFNLHLTNPVKGSYKLILINNAGQVVHQNSINWNNTSNTFLVNMPAKLAAGLLQVELTTPGNKRITCQLIAE